MMIITREFVCCVVAGIQALRAQAAEVVKMPEYKAENGVGDILRGRVESDHQSADMLTGWVKRHLDDVGYPPDKFDI